MVTPSGIFSSGSPPVLRKAVELRSEQEKCLAAHVSGQDVEVAVVHARVTILSDQTSLETERPRPPRNGTYMVTVTMTKAGRVQRRMIPVKARARDSEVAVEQRVHSAFVRSVCEAMHVVPLPPSGEDHVFSLRRASFGPTHVETGVPSHPGRSVLITCPTSNRGFGHLGQA